MAKLGMVYYCSANIMDFNEIYWCLYNWNTTDKPEKNVLIVIYWDIPSGLLT